MSIGSIGDSSYNIDDFSSDSLGSTSEVQSTQSSSVDSSSGIIDRKTIEDILAMLPQPLIDQITSLTLWNNLDLTLGLAAVTDSKRASDTAVGLAEASIVLAALSAWIRSQEAQTAAISEMIRKEDNNPVVAALENYISKNSNAEQSTAANQASSQADIIATSQFLKNSPILLSVLNAANTDLVLKAYQLAEHQVIISLLDKWIAQEAASAEAMRQKDRELFIQEKTSYQKMMSDYVNAVKSGDQTLSQPVLSIIMAGILAGATVSATVSVDPVTHHITFNPITDSVLPVGQQPLGDFINSISSTMPSDFTTIMPQVALEMTQIASAVMISAAYWSIPGAISLLAAEPTKDEKQITLQAVRSFALTVAQFVLRADFNIFVKSRMLSLISNLTEAQYKIFINVLKVVMLACALAALEKSIMGRLTGAEFLSLLGGKTPLAEGDFRKTLVKLIKELLDELPASAKEELLASFATYLDYGPRLESLFDPTRLFLMMWNPRFTRGTTLHHSA